MLNIINLLKTHKNKKKNKFIVSERQYIGITATINAFRSTLASCEVELAFVCNVPVLVRGSASSSTGISWCPY